LNSSNLLDGTLTNGPTFSTDNGGLIDFDGTNDYVNFVTNATSNANIKPTSAISVELWVKFDTIANDTRFASDWNQSGATADRWIYILGTGGRVRFFMRNTAGGDGGADIRDLVTGVWYHMVGTFGDGFQSIYLNGNFANRRIFTGTLVGSNSTYTVKLGGQVSAGPYLDGQIAQFRIYNKCLSRFEVAQNFDAYRLRFGITDPAKTGWIPYELGSDLKLWLDADDRASMIVSSSEVSQWNDKSGNLRNFTQGTAANRPDYVTSVINGKPVLRFNGSTHRLTSSAFLGGSSYVSFMAVLKMNSLTSATQRIFSVDLNANARFVAIVNSSNNYAWFGRRESTDSLGTMNTTVSTTNTVIYESVLDYSTGDGYIRINGTQETSGSSLTSTGVLTSSLSGHAIGSSSTGTFAADMDIAEILIFTSDIGTTDRQKAEGYLAWKWGLQASLPAGHPYENEAP
jgi:hypothetical protein